ncbi:transporter, SSS family protein [Synechococcus sp. PCC 7335]|uniref:sodium:solute symporter family protein n=1 Tax=Synechococcus sp. (strain ATCC 29403 / PCC 7335) TaxID=91464 RepID=UPI00017EDCEA|nr:sodium:solute symporter family protein [Synechococcus sp. PCC 7335]EDX85779.1 transporter, SSS family protein [Synechococcus sp. PCC 7335]
MQPIDWLIVASYLILTLILGAYLSSRALKHKRSLLDGRRSPAWWLLGTSMAATTFSADTPLYIAGIVANRGIAGNWEWWCFGFAHVLMIYLFSRLWRRSEIVTDAELTELRYGGKPAAVLRGVKAFLFAVPLNCLGIGYAMLAMMKVMAVLQSGPGIDALAGGPKLWSAITLTIVVIIYAACSNLWNVVATDFFQFSVALLGSLVVAAVSVNAVGGMRPLVEQLSASNPEMLTFVPLRFDQGIEWSALAAIPSSTFLAYGFLQWWSFRRSDGGGEFAQRLATSKTTVDAEKAAWLFSVLHYVVRTWPWIVSALAAVILYPDLVDKELGYPLLLVDYLPSVVLGVVVTSLIAAFLSTVSTLINWGAAYLTTDGYVRFLSPRATAGEQLLVSRGASILIALLGGMVAFISSDIATIFRLVIAVGTGPGLVLILRWFWWRINAATELAAVVVGFVAGLVTSVGPSGLVIEAFGLRLLVITAVTTLVWVVTMLVTPAESDQVLDCFFAQIRPGGPGWKKQRRRTGLKPLQNLVLDGQKAVAALLVLFGSLFAVGGFLLLQSFTGWLSLIVAVGSGLWLRRLTKQPAFSTPRPGIEDG